MKKLKLKDYIYVFLTIIFIFAIYSFREKIQNFSTNDMNITVDFSNVNNNSNNDKTYIEENYDTNLFTKAIVKRVVDGDTIIATIDGKDYRVRFIGINTPESTTKIEEFGKEASNYTTKMLTGKTVYLEKDVSGTDKFDRLLRYVWLEIPNQISQEEIKEKMFNAILVLNGYAEAATYPPDVKYANYFKEFASFARENNIGLWKNKIE